MTAVIQDIEVPLLLEAIWQRWGYDFRAYAREPLERVLELTLSKTGVATLSGLQERVLHDPDFFRDVLPWLTVTVTSWFREPTTLRALAEHAAPWLETYHHLKVWHAGCATGEEVYSLAILLDELGLLERSLLYGTDINLASLDTAQEGIYTAQALGDAHEAYLEAGGRRDLRDHFVVASGLAQVRSRLRRATTFADHNLVTDGPISAVQVVMCRNTLMYFDVPLRDRVLARFYDALEPGGFLCLGERERLGGAGALLGFERVPGTAAVYRKRLVSGGGCA